MQETITFKLKNGSSELTIKKSFFDKKTFWVEKENEIGRIASLEEAVDIISSEDMYNLINNHNIIKYLHCDTGPAILDLVSGQKLFFIDGKSVPLAEAEKMMYNSQFNNYMDKFLEMPNE